MKPIARLIAVAAVMRATSALAATPLSVWVGQSQTLSVFDKISKIEVSNTDALTVTRVKAGLNLKAKAPGTSSLKITCADGTIYAYDVHMTEGGSIYEV